MVSPGPQPPGGPVRRRRALELRLALEQAQSSADLRAARASLQALRAGTRRLCLAQGRSLAALDALRGELEGALGAAALPRFP